MNDKLEKFEQELQNKIDRTYKQIATAKKEYEAQLKSYGFSDSIGRDIAKIQMLEAKCSAYEDAMDDFGIMFERGKED